jgi:hypothetical protein
MLTTITKPISTNMPELNNYISVAINRLFPRTSKDEIRSFFPELATIGISYSAEKVAIDMDTKSLILHIAFESQRYNLTKKQRADFGSYYTNPKELEAMFEKIKNKKVFNVLEPGCGTGTLIIQYLYSLKNQGQIEVPNITAFDLNANATTLASLLIKLTLKDILGKSFLSIFNKRVHLLNKNVLSLDFTKSNTYDLILMNPPYAKTKDIKTSKEIGSLGKSNFTNIFIEYAFNKLNDDGQILFILGSSSKWGNSYSKINKVLLDQFKFIDFKYKLNSFIDINYETFAFLAKKSSNVTENEIQKKLNTLCFHINKTEESILEKVIKTSIPLTDLFSEVTRGAYIPTGDRQTHRNNNFISSGSNINSYTINEVDAYCSQEHWKNIFNEKRIILKAKRGKLLHSTVCEKNIATTDNIINIQLKNQRLTIETVSMIINSTFMSFFAHTFVFCSETELARIIDKPYLDKFVIPKFSKRDIDALNKISKIVFNLTEKEDQWHYDFERDKSKISTKVMGSKVNTLLRDADDIIFNTLKLSTSEKDYLINGFSKIIYPKNISISKVAA